MLSEIKQRKTYNACSHILKTKSDNPQEKYGMFEVNKPKNSHHKEENRFFFSYLQGMTGAN